MMTMMMTMILITFFMLTWQFTFVAPQKMEKFISNYRPRFDKNFSPLLFVHENTPIGFLLADISRYAVDDEGDKLRYDIDSAGKAICTIGKNDGKLRLKIKPDREFKNEYKFKILVSDDFEGGINRDASIDVYLYIRDENDNKPVFQGTPYHAVISEGADIGAEVFRVHAVDADDGRNKEIRYIFKDNAKHEKFLLNPNTGLITLTAKLDYEAQTSYTLDIIAQDEGSPALTSKTRVLVSVKDVGDNKPYFVLHSYARDIPENLPIGTSIAVVRALDGDKSINNEINYSIIGGDEYGLFFINKKTGNVTVNAELDRELYTEFKLRIKAYEVGEPASFSTIDFHIKLLDKNDNKPKFEKDFYFVRINPENVNEGTLFKDIKVKATDDDATWKNSVITYGIEDNEYFEILPKSGTLHLKNDIGNDITDTYNFMVYATELKTKEHYTAKANVTVQIIRSPTTAPRIAGNFANINSINISILLLLLFVTYTLSRQS